MYTVVDASLKIIICQLFNLNISNFVILNTLDTKKGTYLYIFNG